MKKLFFFNLLLIIGLVATNGQIVRGRVIDARTNEALEFASIGILNTNYGAITDDSGYFEFAFKAQESSSVVRVSMIGYEPQIFTVAELLQNHQEIKMAEKIYEIDEVMINPTNERSVGAIRFNRSQGWSGWGGWVARRGYEMGLKLDLGEGVVKISSLHFMLHRQAFDTCFFRLHIRSINDTTILEELLIDNIIFPITNESGWTNIDLNQYNLVLSGEVGLTLEWLKAQGMNADRKMKINNKEEEAYFLFKNSKNQTGLYRWGAEANWVINKNRSPTMYLTIVE